MIKNEDNTKSRDGMERNCDICDKEDITAEGVVSYSCTDCKVDWCENCHNKKTSFKIPSV